MPTLLWSEKGLGYAENSLVICQYLTTLIMITNDM